ncbi:protein-L-isoaspartate O-methyltransferase [Fistulina hepatica ATCC 64428]|uniref:Protein-L-isoaspartate O-methyltransferase n=1 Tax=Fistulina hepatica ATCC 64428 TaxID=1128425 RepID=A0A0D7A4V2_9AGAR|nr:protein-L-isoaspartate O-methyltransferase [Fistulina hepatica ATCC 64428]
MAWRCSSRTNAGLIANLKSHGIIQSERVEAVDRANYVQDVSTAYEDCPQPIGYGATISAPHMHAYAAESLLPFLRPGARVLDVGSGSGYLTAVLHHLASADARPSKPSVIVGIEHIPELVEISKENIKKDGLAGSDILFVCGDGRKGYPSHGPYDAIHVGAAAPTLVESLVDQLAAPGRMFIPVGTWHQSIIEVDKDETGHVTHTEKMGVNYVLLTDPPKS